MTPKSETWDPSSSLSVLPYFANASDKKSWLRPKSPQNAPANKRKQSECCYDIDIHTMLAWCSSIPELSRMPARRAIGALLMECESWSLSNGASVPEATPAHSIGVNLLGLMHRNTGRTQNMCRLDRCWMATTRRSKVMRWARDHISYKSSIYSSFDTTCSKKNPKLSASQHSNNLRRCRNSSQSRCQMVL